jgi:hypothetical protein
LSALTKMFIVLQLVFALVCAVLLVLMVSKTENYKTNVETEKTKNTALGASYVKAQGEKAAFQEQVADLEKQKSDLGARLEAALKATNDLKISSNAALADAKALLDAATANNAKLSNAIATSGDTIKANKAELDKLRPQVADLTKQYNELYRAKNEVDNQLRRAELDINKYQEMLAQGGGGAGAMAPIGSEKQIQTISSAAAAVKVNAQISNLSQAQGRTLIEMPLGTRDGITVGTKMFVYRASGYVGDATVENVSPEQSVAVITSTKPGETARIGDLVSTVSK